MDKSLTYIFTSHFAIFSIFKAFKVIHFIYLFALFFVLLQVVWQAITFLKSVFHILGWLTHWLHTYQTLSTLWESKPMSSPGIQDFILTAIGLADGEIRLQVIRANVISFLLEVHFIRLFVVGGPVQGFLHLFNLQPVIGPKTRGRWAGSHPGLSTVVLIHMSAHTSQRQSRGWDLPSIPQPVDKSCQCYCGNVLCYGVTLELMKLFRLWLSKLGQESWVNHFHICLLMSNVWIQCLYFSYSYYQTE